MYKDARSVLDAWLAGVNAADVDALASLYDAEAILLPTFSSHTLRDPDAIRRYFVALGSRQGLHVELHERTVRIQAMGGDIHLLAGIYQWQFEIDGEPLRFEARFSYGVDLGREAPIVHHHSSQVPRDLS